MPLRGNKLRTKKGRKSAALTRGKARQARRLPLAAKQNARVAVERTQIIAQIINDLLFDHPATMSNAAAYWHITAAHDALLTAFRMYREDCLA